MTNPIVDPVPAVDFGHSADGLLVARVGDATFAMVPTTRGRHYIASAWRLSRPLVEWRRSDFFGHDGDVADEAAFREYVVEIAVHLREVAALRREDVTARANTPWGPSQGATLYAEGIMVHSTASHGGFHLSADRNRKVHPTLRKSGGWYEEDAEWASVALAWPEFFTVRERKHAEETVRNFWPDAWEAIHGRQILPGESLEKDRQIFERAHTEDWVVISAIFSAHQPGMTEVIATRGGRRGNGAETQRFLVQSTEYRTGPFGFVIDPEQHQAYDGPSSFAAWAPR